MSSFERHRRAAVAAVAVAAALMIGLVLPVGQAGAATFDNACMFSVLPTRSNSVAVTMTATAPAGVRPGRAFGLTINQSLTIPPQLFIEGYDLGTLTTGVNDIPAYIHTVIAATNTVEGSQATKTVPTEITTIVSDPDGIPGSGDETATPGTLSATYTDQTWTAADSGTIDFREATVTPLAPNTGGIVITGMLYGGIVVVRWGCDPGEVVEGANPSTIVLTDPAPSFASTVIDAQANNPPVANAGPDQIAVSRANVTLDGTGSSDPDGDPLTYMWTQTGGTPVTLGGADTATPSFTAPKAEGDLTFQVQVCDQQALCSTDSVVIHANVPDMSMDAIVNGPIRTTQTAQTIVAKVSNVGNARQRVCDTDISWDIFIEGSPTGSTTPKTVGCETLGPGDSTKFESVWNYGPGEVNPAPGDFRGEHVGFKATVRVAGDYNITNNVDWAVSVGK